MNEKTENPKDNIYKELHEHIWEQTKIAVKNQRNSYWLNVLLALNTLALYGFLLLQYSHFEKKVSTGNEVMQFYKEGIFEINMVNRKINYMLELNYMQYNMIYEQVILKHGLDSLYKTKHIYIKNELEAQHNELDKLMRYYRKLDSSQLKLYEKTP